MQFKFKVGQLYQTLDGEVIQVKGRTTSVGYECLICSDNIARYDRSTHSSDAGRVTGTPHDYSHKKNFRHDVSFCLFLARIVKAIMQKCCLC